MMPVTIDTTLSYIVKLRFTFEANLLKGVVIDDQKN